MRSTTPKGGSKKSAPERFSRCSRPKGGVQLLNAKLSWQAQGACLRGFAADTYCFMKPWANSCKPHLGSPMGELAARKG